MLPCLILKLYSTVTTEAKMKSVIFILLLAIGGSMGGFVFYNCKADSCNHIIPLKEIRDLEGLPPTEEVLMRLCPPGLEFMDCASDLIMDCTGQSPEELATSDNETTAMLMGLFTSYKYLGRDLCDEESTLHKNYVTGITCFRNLIRETADECYREAGRIYGVYKDSLSELADHDRDEKGCLVAAYGIACVSIQLRKNCNEAASNAFLEIIKRLKFMKLNVCKPKDVLTLKTNFLDYLEEQGEQRDFFSSAFDFRRRK